MDTDAIACRHARIVRRIRLKRQLRVLLFLAKCAIVLPIIASRLLKAPRLRSVLSGAMYLKELREGHTTVMHEVLRMGPVTFDRLVPLLVETGHMPPVRYMEHDVQAAIFFYFVGTNNSNRVLQNRWQHSAETISKCVWGTLFSLLDLQTRFLTVPLQNAPTPVKIHDDPRFYPFFENCIGALDGTHVSAFVPEVKSAPFRTRKGTLAQNVLGVCGFDMRFYLIHSGWEGSAHDGRVLADALAKGFKIPLGKYYLGDAGYGLSHNLLVPYRGVRYHLKEWGQAHERPSNPKELFNLRHAQLRNVIERIFGAFFKRFPILKNMRSYSFRFQTLLVIALAVLFNILHDFDDSFDDNVEPDPVEVAEDIGNMEDFVFDGGAAVWRDSIADAMWEDYQRILAERGLQ